MKIVLLCWRDLSHPQGGGSERYLERVGEHLASLGHEVIFRTSAHNNAPSRSQRGGMSFLRRGGKFGVYVTAAAEMLAGRAGLGPLRGADLVIDTQNGVPFFATIFSGRPTILLTHHCHRSQWPVAGPVLARLGWWIESWLSPRVHRNTPVVTVSAASMQELVELGFGHDNITIIGNGVDPVPTRLPRIEKDGRLHVVTLSRLVPHKQIEHAIDAVRDLGPDVVLDVIGSGWWEEQLREYARDAHNVVFHGHVAEGLKHALLEQAAVHLLPSRKEGWGIAVIEAAQHGVPTVGYRSSGGLRDSIREGSTGLLADSKEELIAHTHSLLFDAQRTHQLGHAARQFAARFSWAQTGQAWEKLIESCGAGKAARTASRG